MEPIEERVFVQHGIDVTYVTFNDEEILDGQYVHKLEEDIMSVVEQARRKNIVAAARRAGADVRFTVHPEAGHDGWTKSYDNPKLYEWFLSHAKSAVD